MPGIPVSARSIATRQRIVDAARALFSEAGYQRTTVRAIAERASINPALVIRYFGSKEGLFATAAKFDLHLPDLRVVPARRRGQVLASHLLQRWDGPDAGDELPALLAVAITHQDGRRRLVRILRTQLLPMVEQVVAPQVASSSAALIATQALGLALTRYVFKLPPVTSLEDEVVIRFVGATFQRYLDIRPNEPYGGDS